MENLDSVLEKYINASNELNNIINRLAKGDWSKAEILARNKESFIKTIEIMNEAIDDISNMTSVGKLYQTSEEYETVLKKLEDIIDNREEILAVQGYLEHFRDDWEDKYNSGGVDDNDAAESLDALFQLPNYDPDNWLRRKFLIRGLKISSKTQTIPRKIEIGFSESCTCFVYGLFMASIAMTRSVLEAALKDRFPILANNNISLFDITEKSWFMIDKLKNEKDLYFRAKSIRKAGNAALHEYSDKKIIQLVNELAVESNLKNLIIILQFLYK